MVLPLLSQKFITVGVTDSQHDYLSTTRYNGYSAGYAITRTGYAMPELVPERARALARPVP